MRACYTTASPSTASPARGSSCPVAACCTVCFGRRLSSVVSRPSHHHHQIIIVVVVVVVVTDFGCWLVVASQLDAEKGRRAHLVASGGIWSIWLEKFIEMGVCAWVGVTRVYTYLPTSTDPPE